MPTPIQPELLDGVYDRSHPWQQPPLWQNSTDRAAWERTLSQDPVTAAKISSALITADPSTPDELIRDSMTATPVLPLSPSEPITVMECFGPNPGDHAHDYAPSNFSGGVGEFSGSSVPSTPPW